jgi:hypothetical protein
MKSAPRSAVGRVQACIDAENAAGLSMAGEGGRLFDGATGEEVLEGWP